MPSDNLAMNNWELLPFEMGYLPDFYVEKAKLELNESAEARENGLNELKKLITDDKKISGYYREDEFLLQFLRARKFNVQRAFMNLKTLIDFRLKYTALFTDIHFENMRKASDQDFVHIMPYRCHEGCAVILLQIANWEPDDFRIEDFRRLVALMTTEGIKDIMTQVNGYKVIFDFNTNSLKHIRQCTPFNLYLLYHGTQVCLPGRLKSIHFVHLTAVLKVVWMIIKKFVPEKLKERVVFHSESTTLLNYFPKSILPEHYGGELKSFDTLDYIRKASTPENIEKLFTLNSK